jgi:CheY-like chemotaxis protein
MNEGLRMTLSDRLRSEGYVVDFAADGVEGYDKATRCPDNFTSLLPPAYAVDGIPSPDSRS